MTLEEQPTLVSSSSKLALDVWEEMLYFLEGFLADFPGIGKRAADQAKQLTQAELAEIFSSLKTNIWTRMQHQPLRQGPDYKKKNFGDKEAHVFWSRMECGVLLSSLSPWEIIDKKKGETRGGYVC